MRFAHAELSGELNWGEDGAINELVIKSPVFLRQTMQSLLSGCEEGGACLVDQGKPLNFSKQVDIVVNPLRLDFNNRKAMTALLKMLVKASLSEELYMETNKFKASILKYMDQVIDSENFEFNLTTGEFDFSDIAKAVSLRVVDDEDDYIELLTDYMSMLSELTDVKIFIFLNLRSLINWEEMLRLIENVKNHGLNILLVEATSHKKLPCGDRIVVDADLCEL